jgi:hypothetical protein
VFGVADVPTATSYSYCLLPWTFDLDESPDSTVCTRRDSSPTSRSSKCVDALVSSWSPNPRVRQPAAESRRPQQRSCCTVHVHLIGASGLRRSESLHRTCSPRRLPPHVDRYGERDNTDPYSEDGGYAWATHGAPIMASGCHCDCDRHDLLCDQNCGQALMPSLAMLVNTQRVCNNG